jgi:hypothetical protein
MSEWSAFDALLTSPFKRGYVNLGGVSLYIRHAPRLLDGQRIDSLLQIANIEAESPGSGAFSALLPQIEASAKAAGIGWIYIENVLQERFRLFWLRQGYHRVDASRGPYDFCYAKRLTSKG